MKKIVIALIVILAVLGILFIVLYPFERDGITKNAEIIIGRSEIFAQSDFEETRDVILEDFKDYKNCELIKLVYDEEFSEKEKSYYDYPDDVMVWYSDFQTGESYGSGFNDNCLYSEWKWIMCKFDDGQWQIKAWGLC